MPTAPRPRPLPGSPITPKLCLPPLPPPNVVLKPIPIPPSCRCRPISPRPCSMRSRVSSSRPASPSHASPCARPLPSIEGSSRAGCEVPICSCKDSSRLNSGVRSRTGRLTAFRGSTVENFVERALRGMAAFGSRSFGISLSFPSVRSMTSTLHGARGIGFAMPFRMWCPV